MQFTSIDIIILKKTLRLTQRPDNKEMEKAMIDFTEGEKRFLSTLNLSQKCEQEVKKVWLEREYKQQREYTNLLLFLIPFFVLVLMATSTYEYLMPLKLFMGGIAWTVYFAIPVFFILKICYKILGSEDRSVLLGHSAMYMWRKPKVIKRVYNIAATILLMFILAKTGLEVTAVCLGVTFIVVLISTLKIRTKVQKVLDEIENS